MSWPGLVHGRLSASVRRAYERHPTSHHLPPKVPNCYSFRASPCVWVSAHRDTSDTMQVVAHFLQIEALKIQGSDKDLYARSAYNRYYYDIFLATRRMFSELDASWALLAHKDYPGLLRGQITRQFKLARTKAVRADDSELQSILDAAVRGASALANLNRESVRRPRCRRLPAR